MLAHILCILAQNLTTGVILEFHLQVPIATTTDIVKVRMVQLKKRAV